MHKYNSFPNVYIFCYNGLICLNSQLPACGTFSFKTNQHQLVGDNFFFQNKSALAISHQSGIMITKTHEGQNGPFQELLNTVSANTVVEVSYWGINLTLTPNSAKLETPCGVAALTFGGFCLSLS
jgi:hypothetical protein